MRNFITLTLLVFSMQCGYAQACGIYQLKFAGEVICNNAEIVHVELPAVSFLHGFGKGKSKTTFIQTELVDGRIDVETASPMTSHLYDDAGDYLKLYKSNRARIPLTFHLQDPSTRRVKKIDISVEWDQVTLEREARDKEVGVLTLNLHTIELAGAGNK